MEETGVLEDGKASERGVELIEQKRYQNPKAGKQKIITKNTKLLGKINKTGERT